VTGRMTDWYKFLSAFAIELRWTALNLAISSAVDDCTLYGVIIRLTHYGRYLTWCVCIACKRITFCASYTVRLNSSPFDTMAHVSAQCLFWTYLEIVAFPAMSFDES